MNFSTLCIGDSEMPKSSPSQLPIYPTSSFVFETFEEEMEAFSGKTEAFIYSRFGNPTTDLTGQKIAALEGHNLNLETYGYMTSSGMSAISTLLLAVLKPGDKILTQGNLYGGTTELLVRLFAKLNIEPLFVDLKNISDCEVLLKSNAGAVKAIYFETPSNPTLDCVDIEALARLAQQYGCLSICDNTFATPYLQQPFRFGVDYIIHSCTKYLCGHGTSISGAIIGKDKQIMHNQVLKTLKLLGTNASPFEAWLTYNGIKTLEIRMNKHTENALELAHRLQKHPKVKKVLYNGLPEHPDYQLCQKQMRMAGGMLSFELENQSLPAISKFMNALKHCKMAPTMGDLHTLVLHPATMSHLNVSPELRLQNGITDGLIRLSVGIESVEDIWNDLAQALT
jgi:methionine-gamma-lyase